MSVQQFVNARKLFLLISKNHWVTAFIPLSSSRMKFTQLGFVNLDPNWNSLGRGSNADY